MWDRLSNFILKNRFFLIIFICLSTILIARFAVNVEYSVERAQILPSSHQVFLDNEKFRSKYGDNHVMALAISDSKFFDIERFNFWDSLCDSIDDISGVKNIIS